MAKREINPVNTDDLNEITEVKESEDLIITTKTKKSTKKPAPKARKATRPTRFKEPQVTSIVLPLTQTQKDLIDERVEELGIRVRLDYIRGLIGKDIEGFEA